MVCVHTNSRRIGTMLAWVVLKSKGRAGAFKMDIHTYASVSPGSILIRAASLPYTTQSFNGQAKQLLA